MGFKDGRGKKNNNEMMNLKDKFKSRKLYISISVKKY